MYDEDELNFGTFKGDDIAIIQSRVELTGATTLEIVFMSGPREGEETRIDADASYNDLEVLDLDDDGHYSKVDELKTMLEAK